MFNRAIKVAFGVVLLACWLSAPAYVTVSGTISSSQTWGKSSPATDGIYWVTGNVTVSNGAVLTIEAGVVVKFGGPYSLGIGGTGGGTLTAQGTSSEPIYFTSIKDDTGGDTNGDGGATSPAPGDWYRINFASGSSGIIDYCVVRYGGGYTNYEYNISCTSGAPSQITNSTISHSFEIGLYCANGIRPSVISGCAFSDNGTFPVSMYPNDVSVLAGNNSFVSNGSNGVFLAAQTLATASHSWINPGVPFYMGGILTVPSGGSLALSPGTVMKFPTAAHLTISGSMNATGTSGSRIVFTSYRDDANGGDTNGDGPSEGVAGDWYYLRINTGAGSVILDHCDILYAGGYLNYHYALYVLDGGSSSVTNCVFRNSKLYGVYCNTAGQFPPVFSGNYFSDMPDFPIRLHARDTGKISANNIFGTLTKSGVRVVGESLPAGSYTWSKLAVPYAIDSSVTVANGAILTISPGAVLKFDTSTNISVSSGTFNAQGNELDRITFTSYRDDSIGGDTNGDGPSTPEAGDWWYIRFDGGTGVIDHADILFAGGYLNYNYAVYCYNSAPSQITNSRIAHSAKDGLFCATGYAPGAVALNEFEGCGRYPIQMDPKFAPVIASSNTFTGNHHQCVYLYSQTLTSATPLNIAWNKLAVPFWLAGNVTVDDNVTFHPGAGNILKMNPSGHITTSGGILDFTGTAEDPITVTSIKDDSTGGDTNADGNATAPASGDWWFIRYQGGADLGSLDYTYLKYGGGYTGFNQIIYIENGCPTSIDNCTIRNSLNRGIYALWASTNTVITNTTIRDNQRGITIASGGANPVIGGTSGQGNEIYANSVYGVENLGTICVDARYNYWGADSGPNDASAAADTCLLGINAGTGDAVTNNVDYTGFVGSGFQPPDPPTPLYPASPSESGSATPVLTVTNSPSPGTLMYRFQVARNTSFTIGLQESLVSPGSGTTSWTVPSTLNENTTHYWRCRVEDQGSALPSSWTDIWRFFTNSVNDPPNAPYLNSPSNLAQVDTFTPGLTVNNTADPDDNETMDYLLTYEFAVYSDSGMTSLVWSQSGVSEGINFTNAAVGTDLSEDTQYWWRARANDGTQDGSWSGSRSFYVSTENDPPSAPANNSPADNTYQAVLQPNLYLDNANDPDHDDLSYTFEVSVSQSFLTLAASTTKSGNCCTGTTGWTVSPPLEYSRWHWWRANAADSEYTSGYSSPTRFITAGFPMPEESARGYMPSISEDTARGDRVYYTFPGTSGGVTIVYQVYNIPAGQEDNFIILAGGTIVGSQGAACPGAWSSTRSVFIDDGLVNDSATNVICFQNPLNLPDSFTAEWGVRMVGLNIPAPDPVYALPYNTVIDVAWSPVQGVAGYNVYRSATAGGPYSKVNASLVTGELFRDSGLVNGTTYHYVVRSENVSGIEGLSSLETSAVPTTAGGVTPVTDLKVFKNGSDARLLWTPITTENPVQHYKVYRVLRSSTPPFTRTGAEVLGTPGTSPWDHAGVLGDENLYYYDVATVDSLDQEASE